LAAVVPAVDEGPDLDHEVSDGGKGAAVDGLAFDDAEPHLDQVQPRSRGLVKKYGVASVPFTREQFALALLDSAALTLKLFNIYLLVDI
jgi:hypothetical protein